ncbi:MAG: histidine--tRNA ligase, partial [Actinobacteria bacterium]|nr:histidine--tRNA ligase [Actinomycetota bacterium]
PKGTYDILPGDQTLRRWLIARAEDVFRRYGYRRIDTPTFEETRLFSRGVGESTDIVRKEMYTFEDLGGRSMTLRPEGTAPVARAYVEHGMHTLPQPVKLYYHSPMFRYESPQSGRYRQHYQLGIEAFGSTEPEVDAEVIGVLAALYGEIGLGGLELRLNSMGCKECRPGYMEKLRAFLTKHAEALCQECRERAAINPLRTFDCKVPSCREVLETAPRLADHLCPACSQHHARVQECLAVQGISFATDHSLVRGMDYYTRTTFEFQSSLLGAQSGVGGGGRYDGLVEAIGGPPTPGVGFGTGIERILLALARAEVQVPEALPPLAYLVGLTPEGRKKVFALAHELRLLGAAVDLDYMSRSAKGQMKQAGRSGARYAFIVGEQELADGVITVRDLRSGEEESLTDGEVMELAKPGTTTP